MSNTEKKYEGITIYGKGDSALGIAPLVHERDNELKGYKINITSTLNNFKDKDMLYLEQNEILEFISVIIGYNTEAKSIRGKNVSGKNKNVSIKRVGDMIFINFDIEGKSTLSFVLNNINKIIFYEILIKQALLEIKRLSNITITRQQLETNIYNLITSTNTSNNGNNTENIENNDNYIKCSYINSYNGKDYTNEFNLEKDFYNKHIENTEELFDMEDGRKIKAIQAIKKATLKSDLDKNKFLNISNFNTLQFNI